MLTSTKYDIGDVVYAVDTLPANDNPHNPRRTYCLSLSGMPLIIINIHTRYSRHTLGRDKRHEYEFHTWYATAPYSGNPREAKYLFDTLEEATEFVKRANANDVEKQPSAIPK
jgi:hypothetical protein